MSPLQRGNSPRTKSTPSTESSPRKAELGTRSLWFVRRPQGAPIEVPDVPPDRVGRLLSVTDLDQFQDVPVLTEELQPQGQPVPHRGVAAEHVTLHYAAEALHHDRQQLITGGAR